MQTAHRPFIPILAGLALLVASFCATSVFSGGRVWSDADAQAYTRASSAYHAAKLGVHSHAVGEPPHGHSTTSPVSLEEAERQFAAEQRRLDAARNRGTTIAVALRALGVLCLAAGVLWWWRGQGRE